MKRTKEIIVSTVKVPLYVLTGLFSRLLFVALLPIGIFLSLKAAVRKILGLAVAPEPELLPGLEPELLGLKYFHQGHTWAVATAAGTVTVGLDDFAQKIIGTIDSIELPRIGQTLRQGKIAWKLRHGQRILPQVAPIEGTVIEVNEDLQKSPSLANRSPYEKGWVLKVKPTRLKENLRNLIHGDIGEKWLDLAKSQFVLRFPRAVGPAYQDGGELIDNVGDTLTDEEWERVKREFFL
ncbi:MAG: glycine cleavage system protein H [candidate division KSB1 bacterium]|nr:glycine cleavage system protein H [candidate division KSB1 bacterium]